MSMYQATDFQKEFAKRILDNFTLNNRNYEITDSITSFLGVLVFLKEGKSGNKILKDIVRNNSEEEVIENIKNKMKKETDIEQLFRHLRNSIAHANIKPYEENESVAGFEFKDYSSKEDKNSDKTNFELTLSVNEIASLQSLILNKILRD